MIANTLSLSGDRLKLRPFSMEDAPRVTQLCNNWNVASNLSRAPFPYPQSEADEWIATHDDERATGSGWAFAIEAGEELVGGIGLSRKEADRPFEIGYWLGEPYWGRGYATEAARLTVAFAFDILGLLKLEAFHFADNPASGKVLEKSGFRYTGETDRFCLARGHDVHCLVMELRADEVRQ